MIAPREVEPAALGRIETALANMGAYRVPRTDWTSLVLAELARGSIDSSGGASPLPPVRSVVAPPVEPRSWLRWFAFGGLAAAAAVILLLVVRPSVPVDDLALEVTWEHGGPVVRGGDAHAGDVVHAAVTGRARYRAIWVYRGDRELMFTCPAAGQAAKCAQKGVQLRADLAVPAGVYTFVALSGDEPLPVPHGSFDEDLAAVAKSSAVVRRRQLRVE